MSESKINGASGLRMLEAPVAPGQLPAALRKEAAWMRNQMPVNRALRAHAVILTASAEHIERLEKHTLDLMADAIERAQELEKCRADLAAAKEKLALFEEHVTDVANAH